MKQTLLRRALSRTANGVIGLLPPIRVFHRGPGFGLYVYLNDPAIGAKLLLRNAHEPEVTRLLGKLLRPGSTFVDVGANIGYHTLLGCALTGPEGRVIAVEPDPGNCRLLRESAERNGFRNLTVHQVAAADRPRRVGFGEEFGSNKQISLEAEHGEIRAVTLDEILHAETRVDVLKIDIEGAEGLALTGAQTTLARHRPVLLTEFMPMLLQKVSGISGGCYLDRLRGAGYAIHLADDGPPATNEEIFDTLARSRYRHLDLLARPS